MNKIKRTQFFVVSMFLPELGLHNYLSSVALVIFLFQQQQPDKPGKLAQLWRNCEYVGPI